VRERGVSRRILLTLLAITAAAAALRLWGLTFGLPRAMARPDEEAITAVAARLVRIGPNPHFFDYPTLFIAVVAAIEKWWPGGQAVFDDVLPTMIARSLAAGLGTASVPLVFAITRRFATTRAALAAAALLAVAFLHVRDSHFGVTDTPMTFMVLLAFYATVVLVAESARWWGVLIAAILCGLATSTKYNALIVVVPLLVAMIQVKSPPWLYALAAAGVAGGFLFGTPYAWYARREFVRDLIGLGAHLAGGHGADEGRGWVHHLTFTLRYGLGLPFLIAAIAGGVVIALRDARRALLLLSFPVVYYLGMGSGRTVFMRHMLPVVPFAAIAAGVFVDWVSERVSRTEWRRPLNDVALVATVLTAVLGVDSAVRAMQLDARLAVPDTRTLAAQMLEARLPQGASVYQNGPLYARVQLWPEGIFPQTPIERLPQFVIINSSPLTAYRDEPANVRPILAERYRLLGRFEAEFLSDPTVGIYDQQDAFFLPVARFDRVRRPGPTLEIFERLNGAR
jgi:4-amino-4-deoxy-L-arabinose transferase-like glycosyltransferase